MTLFGPLSAFFLLSIAMLMAVVRVLRGPTLADRILGLDVATTLGVGLIAVFAMTVGQWLYLDVAIALALVGFVATVAFARYLISREEQ
ncbi:MAG TPA: monovalent cation/H+ antiporter complex subunit F [Devosia sp.]|nr:monovalent cation/H+ antiporter complex subunit F [Devosia sp.]